MTSWFQRLSLKAKLIVVIVTTAAISLLLPGAAMVVYEVMQIRESWRQSMTSQSEIVAVSSAAALTFEDREAAQEVLASLRVIPGIAHASLFDTRGQLFAEYRASGRSHDDLPILKPESPGRRFENGYLLVFRPVYLREDLVGSIALAGDMREQNTRLAISFTIVISALVGAVIVAILLSTRLQRLISEPILALTAVARRITVNKDYSLRASPAARDEIGSLVTDFNEMLAEIERRDSRLRISEERFRQLAETISEVFWMSDPEKNTILYVSPGYEEIWGLPAANLYASPRDWLDAIHPDDRDRVAASLPRQKIGQYNEEYRIVRPDGTVRWIHDRAFPVRDANGSVYRIAGIAEDVTSKKQLEKQVLEISDREQTRFGQDLHDGLCQHLVRIGFAVNVMKGELAREKHPQTGRAAQLASLVDQAITQARNLARGLYPVKVQTEGLLSALEELAAHVCVNEKVNVEVHWPEQHQIRDYSVAVHLYRIAQEAVVNAVKHAWANRIIIALTDCGDHHLRLTITDDGIGMRAKTENQGLGLHIMKYRAGMIHAVLDVNSSMDGGTVVSCTFRHRDASATGKISENV